MKITITKTHKKRSKDSATVVFIKKGASHLAETTNGKEIRISLEKQKEVTPRVFRILLRTIVQTAKTHKISQVIIPYESLLFPKVSKAYTDTWLGSTIAENLLLASYEYTKYKSKTNPLFPKECVITGAIQKDIQKGVERGTIVATYTNKCRDIANTPGGDMTPALLAKDAQEIVKGTNAKVTVLSEQQIKKLKMGALLAVGKGAKDKPKFIIVEYWGAGKKSKEKPLVFVGKGITFDTGGLQIKPGMAMYEMHMDMSGGAAVIAAVAAIAKLGLKKNVVALVPAAENAVSDESVRPGDVAVSMSGKTIDILHTDAEGRLVLADGLTYARKYDPRLVIDVATLTGAALVAVGQHANVIMTKNRKLEDKLRDLGEESGDYVAPLPLWEEYRPQLKGVHADISNIPSSDTRYGGSIIGGTFLSFFTEGLLWAHIDMAPRMTAISSDKLIKGAAGEPVRLLVKIAETL